MERLERASVLLNLVGALRSRGSWASETHFQKATYFLQELLRVPLEFEFILYKHGPFSFDLREDLSAMLADSFLQWEPQPPFGPSLIPGPAGDVLKRQYPLQAEILPRIEFVAEKLAPKRVVELERLATALFVTMEGTVDEAQRAPRICELKPHIQPLQAQQAVQEVDEICREAAERFY